MPSCSSRLPYPDPDQLMVVGEDFDGRGRPSDVSIGNFSDWRTHAKSFSALGASNYFNFNLSDEGRPERVLGARVTHTWFSVMGVAAEHGRVFGAADDAPGNDHVVVLSHRLWSRRYGADPSVVGRSIQLNAVPYAVIGVMPARFDVTSDAEELWVPIAFTPAQMANHDEHYLSVTGRLAPGVSQAQAAAEMRAIHGQMKKLYPGDSQVNLAVLEPLHTQFVGDYRQRLLVLLGAVTLVLLIACGNVANLLLARGGIRAREMAVRAAIGASRGRIVRQLLTETLVLTAIGGAVGVLLAWLAVPALVAYAPEGVPRLERAHVDGIVLAFALVTALVSAIDRRDRAGGPGCSRGPARRAERRRPHRHGRPRPRSASSRRCGGRTRDRAARRRRVAGAKRAAPAAHRPRIRSPRPDDGAADAARRPIRGPAASCRRPSTTS